MDLLRGSQLVAGFAGGRQLDRAGVVTAGKLHQRGDALVDRRMSGEQVGKA
jgi:hypothetical protein